MILGSDTFTLLSRKDVVKSRQMFFVYTRYWCSKKGLPYTVTTAARVWNGGPDGNTKPHTVEYAKNVLRRIS